MINVEVHAAHCQMARYIYIERERERVVVVVVPTERDTYTQNLLIACAYMLQ